MQERTCSACGKPLPAGSRRDRRFCGASCWQKHNRATEVRPCSVEGCDLPLRARGLCSTHYNQQHQPNRHRKIEVPCTYCSEPCEKHPSQVSKYQGVFCSLICRDLWRFETGTNPHPPQTVCRLPDDHPARWIGKTSAITYTDCRTCGATIAHDARQRRAFCSPACRQYGADQPRFVAGYCPRCNVPFTADRLAFHGFAVYCSLSCARADGKDRRRARKRNALVAPVHRRHIFERDGWRCQLCKRRVDPTKAVPHPRAPTIDHVVPLAAGGTHEPSNVQTACFICNATKGDRGTDQLRLIG